MAIKPIKINNFKGGLNLNEDTTIEDNQLSLATNMYYDENKRLSVRRGQDNFGSQMSDTIVSINTCDATTNWVASVDAANVAAGTAIRGTFSVEFDIDVSANVSNVARLTNASLGTIDCSSANGYLGFWMYIPADFNTNLTYIVVRIGSDSSNYHQWIVQPSDIIEDANNFFSLAFADATDVGTPDDSSIDWFQIAVVYDAAYTDKNNILIDSIYCYSDTYTEGCHSLHFWEDSSGTRRLIAGCGTNLFQYNEDTEFFEVIKTGLSGEKFSFASWDDVLYLTNGTDDYASWNGTLYSEYSGADIYNGKYLIVANDVGYIAGVSGATSVLYYSDSSPADMQTFVNEVIIDSDNGQVITGLANLGPIVLVFKERSIYDVNIATPSLQQLDYSGGCSSHRSITRVENDVYFMDRNGVFSLAQREGTTGSLRATSKTEDLQPLIDTLRNLNITAGIYWEKTNQYYLAVDTNNNGLNDGLLVYDAIVKAWTKYVGINATDFTIYVDSDGIEHLLYASEYSGRVVEMETGFNDNEVEITASLATKNFNFNEPSLSKEYREIDIIGFISETAEVSATIYIDELSAEIATIDGSSYADSGTGGIVYGVHPMGIYPYTGGDIVAGEIELNAFKIRIPVYNTGVNVKIGLVSAKKNTDFILSKIQIVPEAEPFDFFPNDEIA